MSDAVRKTIALVASAALLGIAYYGSYLPLQKSEAFIAALRRAPTFQSLQDFQSTFNEVLAMPSPIGQEELVRNLSNMVLNVISANGQNLDLTSNMVQYIEGHFRPIMESGRGMSFTQNLYVLGNINQLAFIKTHDSRYLEAARQIYLAGYARGEKRPQFLYGLIDVYRLSGDANGILGVSGKVLALWPTDERVSQLVADVQKSILASSTSKSIKK